MPSWIDRIPQLQEYLQKNGSLNLRDQQILDYYNKIQQYQGTDYYDLLLQNPYVGQEFGGTTVGNLLSGDNQSDSFWSQGSFLGSLLNALTFGSSSAIGQNLNRTAETNFYQQQSQAANEEMSRILEKKQENEYNSPSAQAARQIAAGINPNLAGVGGTAASSATGPNETASPLSSGAISDQMTGQIAQIGNLASSFVSGALNLYSFFQDAAGKSISNAAGDIDLADNVYNYAVKTAAGLSGLPSTREGYDALSEAEKVGADETLFETLQAAIKTGDLGSMQLNQRARRMLKKMTGRVMYDKEGKPTLAFQSQRATMLKQFYGDTLEAGKAAGHPVMSTPEDFVSVIEKSMQFFGDYESKLMEYQKKILPLMERLQAAQTVSAERQSQYDTGYLSEELGQSDAEAKKALNELEKVQSDMDSYLDKSLDTLMESLGDGMGAKIAKISLVSLRMVLKNLTASIAPFGKAGKLKPSFSL